MYLQHKLNQHCIHLKQFLGSHPFGHRGQFAENSGTSVTAAPGSGARAGGGLAFGGVFGRNRGAGAPSRPGGMLQASN